MLLHNVHFRVIQLNDHQLLKLQVCVVVGYHNTVLVEVNELSVVDLHELDDLGVVYVIEGEEAQGFAIVSQPHYQRPLCSIYHIYTFCLQGKPGSGLFLTKGVIAQHDKVGVVQQILIFIPVLVEILDIEKSFEVFQLYK